MSYDFTTFTVVGSHIVNTDASHVNITGLTRNETSYNHLTGTYANNTYWEGSFSISGYSGAGVSSFNIGAADGTGTAGGTSATVNETSLLASCVAGPVYSASIAIRESSAGSSAVILSGLTASTTYYSGHAVLTSLGGQYGAAFGQIYSDSARTTRVGAAIKSLTALPTYTELFAGQSISTADATAINGAIGAITPNTVTVGEDCNAMSGSDTTIATYAGNTNIIVCTALPGNSTTAQKFHNGGAGYYSGDYVQYGVLNQTAWSSTAGNYLLGVLSNNTGDQAQASCHNRFISVTRGSSATATLKLRETNGSSAADSTGSLTHTFGQPVFWKKWFVTADGKEYLAIYSDPLFQNIIGTAISLTVRETIAFQYSMPVSSCGTGGSANTATFTIGGYSASPGAAINVSVGLVSRTRALHAATVTVAGSSINVSVGRVMRTRTLYPATVSQVGNTNVNVAVLSRTRTLYPALITLTGSAITEPFELTAVNNSGVKQTGQTVYLEVFDSSNARQQYDWVSKSFKSPASYNLTLAEFDSVNQPGYYNSSGDTTVWNGVIKFHAWYVSTEDGQTKNYWWKAEYLNGIEVLRSSRATDVGVRTEMDSNSTKLDMPVSGVAAATLSAMNANPPDVNVAKVNGHAVTGDGHTGAEWGPA